MFLFLSLSQPTEKKKIGSFFFFSLSLLLTIASLLLPIYLKFFLIVKISLFFCITAILRMFVTVVHSKHIEVIIDRL